MDEKQQAALRALAHVVEDKGNIAYEQHVAEAIGVRNSEAVQLIDYLAGNDYVKLGDTPNTFGSQSTRAV